MCLQYAADEQEYNKKKSISKLVVHFQEAFEFPGCLHMETFSPEMTKS